MREIIFMLLGGQGRITVGKENSPEWTVDELFSCDLSLSVSYVIRGFMEMFGIIAE